MKRSERTEHLDMHNLSLAECLLHQRNSVADIKEFFTFSV
ncbi:hypothetical protein BVRB_7g163920 [Beta vulgaris subsp. vulgaris]|nr:hypothetical protein BVRB_7g163920 [Beta vulgaris subsp. vulgaris]